MRIASQIGWLALILSLTAPLRADDAQDIQGKWQVTTMKFAGQDAPADKLVDYVVTIEGDMLSMPQSGSVKIKLDPSKDPKQIDFEEDKEKPKTYGIYKLAGGELSLCVAPERPTEFKSETGSQNFLMIMKKK